MKLIGLLHKSDSLSCTCRGCRSPLLDRVMCLHDYPRIFTHYRLEMIVKDRYISVTIATIWTCPYCLLRPKLLVLFNSHRSYPFRLQTDIYARLPVPELGVGSDYSAVVQLIPIYFQTTVISPVAPIPYCLVPKGSIFRLSFILSRKYMYRFNFLFWAVLIEPWQ